ncbi:MAG: general secretion pathway protein GspK [Sedimentisphaerales bacterium]|nr:general secretion pathway protein GspK [Sedimentisphaerales bacterium]
MRKSIRYMPYKKRQSGFVLLVTVIIIAASTAIILAYSKQVRIAYEVCRQNHLNFRLRNAADSGLAFALAYLNDNKEKPVMTNLNARFDDIECSIIIESENGKININQLVNKSDNHDMAYTELLLRLIDVYNDINTGKKISYSMVPSIIDAIDKNDDVCELEFIAKDNSGGENSYYRDRDLPEILNRPLQQITDVYLVKNCPSEILAHKPDEQTRAFVDCLTTASIKKIDINSAPGELIAALSDELTLDQARTLTVTGKQGQYASLSEFYTAADISETNALSQILEVNPAENIYTITILAKSGYKTIKLIAQAEKDDNSIYNGKKMYCN